MQVAQGTGNDKGNLQQTFSDFSPSVKGFFSAGKRGLSNSIVLLQRERWERDCPPAAAVLLGGIVGQSVILLGWAFKLQPTKKSLELGHGDDFSG